MDEPAEVVGARTPPTEPRCLEVPGGLAGISFLACRLPGRPWDTGGPWVGSMPDSAI